jgi:CRISPR/Cas system-associated exonuclease Cas4 (RecB family)
MVKSEKYNIQKGGGCMRLLDYANEVLTAKAPYPNSKRLPNVFYPTEASIVVNVDGKPKMYGKCARAVYMRMTGIEPTSDKLERAQRIFGYGKYFEQNEIDLYKRAGIYVANNVKFSMPIPNSDSFVSGEVDGIVKIDGKYIGVEFKTSYGNSFIRQNITGYKRKGKSTGLDYTLDDLLPAPKIEHIMQVMLYMDYYRDSGINEFHIVYSARDSMAMAEYKLWLDERADGKRYVRVSKLEADKEVSIPIINFSTQDIYDRYIYIRRHILKNQIPPPDYDVVGKTNWQCGYCEFRQACLDQLEKLENVESGMHATV